MSIASRLSTLFPLPKGKALGVLIAVIGLLLLVVTAIEVPVLLHTHGNVLFPLDNAYVDITVARNLAFYQVWGVSKYAFQSAATSLLYPLALAPVFFVGGAHLLIPLILNVGFGAYFLLFVQRMLIRYDVSPARQLLILLGTMIVTMLPLLVVSGMEYALQLLCVFLFVDELSQTVALTGHTNAPANISANTPAQDPVPQNYRRLYLLGALAVAARYEDLLVIALACIYLGRQKKRKQALTLAAAAVSPILLFGIISLIKKSYFLPNTMLLGQYSAVLLTITILTMMAAVWWLIRHHRSAPAMPPASGLMTKMPALLIMVLPFTLRNGMDLLHFQRDCIQVYDRQYPAAAFVHLYYNKSTVGINQPGAVSYFSEGRKLDYTGIASLDVTEKRARHTWNPAWADSLSKLDGIRIAVVADPWFTPEQLPKWTRIASWNFPDAGGVKKIMFYAIEDYDTSLLRRNLHSYQCWLPANVSVRYY